MNTHQTYGNWYAEYLCAQCFYLGMYAFWFASRGPMFFTREVWPKPRKKSHTHTNPTQWTQFQSCVNSTPKTYLGHGAGQLVQQLGYEMTLWMGQPGYAVRNCTPRANLSKKTWELNLTKKRMHTMHNVCNTIDNTILHAQVSHSRECLHVFLPVELMIIHGNHAITCWGDQLQISPRNIRLQKAQSGYLFYNIHYR